MTFREKIKIEHPEKINSSASGGVLGCPIHYGYEQYKPCSYISEEICTDCWDREIEGEELKDNKTVLEIHGEICDSMKELYREKNKAYGNSFHNARKEVPCYTLGKLYDKFSRYMNLVKNPENAAFESIEDTLLDMANYCVMELAEMKCEVSHEE